MINVSESGKLYLFIRCPFSYKGFLSTRGRGERGSSPSSNPCFTIAITYNKVPQHPHILRVFRAYWKMTSFQLTVRRVFKVKYSWLNQKDRSPYIMIGKTKEKYTPKKPTSSGHKRCPWELKDRPPSPGSPSGVKHFILRVKLKNYKQNSEFDFKKIT